VLDRLDKMDVLDRLDKMDKIDRLDALDKMDTRYWIKQIGLKCTICSIS